MAYSYAADSYIYVQHCACKCSWLAKVLVPDLYFSEYYYVVAMARYQRALDRSHSICILLIVSKFRSSKFSAIVALNSVIRLKYVFLKMSKGLNEVLPE